MNGQGKSFGKFLLLWTGNFISSIGSGLTSFGLGVYIFEQTKKASLMALVTLLAFLPSLLLNPLAGVLADRYDRRLLMVLGDSFSAVGLLFILICFMQGNPQVWQICVGVTISSVFASLLEPAYKATLTVQKGLKEEGIKDGNTEKIFSVRSELKEGWNALAGRKGILPLVLMGALITFCLGVIQTLASPMVLSFKGSAVLGTLMTVTASGMLVSGILLGGMRIRKGYVRMLSASLCAAGFLFFATLPFANASLDYLLRSNIDNSLQGGALAF